MDEQIRPSGGPDDPLVFFSDRLPPGSIAETFCGVVGYLDPSGQMAYCVIHAGGAVLSTYVGLLELGKVRLIEHFEQSMGWDDAG